MKVTGEVPPTLQSPCRAVLCLLCLLKGNGLRDQRFFHYLKQHRYRHGGFP